MAWLSRVNFIASDTLSFSDINNLGNDIRAWGGNVNGGGYVLSNVVLSAFDLSTCFGLPISTGVSGLGTGVATFLATPSSANLAAAVTNETGTGALVFATSPTLVTPLLGTPTSGTLTNCTGLPVSTGVSGLGTGVATFLATPSSANLASAVTDETGTGALVFATSPTLVTPTITTSAVIPLVNGGTAVSSTLTLQSTSGAGSSDAIIFKTASQSERMRILTTGEVGIGTASPAANLTIQQSSDSQGVGGLRLYRASGASSCALLQGGDSNTYLGNLSASGGLSLTGGNSFLTSTGIFINSSNNVGIGTASPGAKLDVRISSTAGVGTIIAQFGSQVSNRMQIYDESASYAATILTSGSLPFLIAAGALGSGASLALGANGTENMRILSSGNVGIGTTIAGQKLDVLSVGGLPATSGTTQNGIARFQSTTTNTLDIGASAISPFGVWLQGTNVNGLGNTYPLLLNPNGGNVGIGTTSPAYKLEVNGTVGVGNATDNATRAITFNTASGGSSQIQSITVGATNQVLAFRTTFSTEGERMRIDGQGLVGIGTTSPAANLTIQQSSDSQGVGGLRLYRASGASSCALLQGGDSNTYLGNLSVSNGISITAGNSFLTTVGIFINSSNNVGIGTNSAAYKLEIGTDSAGKPGTGGLWTVVSDERIKTDITPANLDRCYEIVKSVPLKHFGFAPGVYTDDQINDKHSLGWIAQDVQKVFSKAVSVKPFTLKTAIPDGTEEYTEQDFTLEIVEKTETSIQVIDSKPVQVSKVVTSENKVLLFDSVDVVDEAGAVVMDGDKPLTYQMPRMVTKTRNKVRHDVIEDCLDLNGGQMIAALYGAVQALMLQVESLKARN